MAGAYYLHEEGNIMFSVGAGTAEERNLVALDEALAGKGVRVEGFHDGTLFCRIEDKDQGVGHLRTTLEKALGALDAETRERIHQIYLEE